jgi:DNA-binding transcriptional MerR regulator
MSEDVPIQPAPSTYTIDELARLGATTVRNIRAYQERGILPAPVRHGRAGIYGDTHLAQLRIIAQLLGRGYSIANISELFEAHARGQSLNHLIGIDTALTSQWVAHMPTLHTLEDLVALLPTPPTTEDIGRAFQMGILEPAEKNLVRLRSPVLIKLAIRFMEQGFSLNQLLNLMQSIYPSFTHIAESLSAIAVQVALGNTPPQTVRNAEYTEQRIRLIWSLRPMVSQMVEQEIALSLSTALQRQMTEQLIQTMTEKRP